MNRLHDFRSIAPRLGSQHQSFEEFCCQNARHSKTPPPPPGSEFVRFRGAGGDGGVECLWRLPTGKAWGWQAKYLFDLPLALAQLTESFETAIRIHPELERYTVCIPFDLTGPTGRSRKGRGTAGSEFDRFTQWRDTHEELARQHGLTVTIHHETATILFDSLGDYDKTGGRQRYWFDTTVFGSDWFAQHLEEVRHIAGPRYTPTLSIEVPVGRVIESLTLTDEWFTEIRRRYDHLRKAQRKWQDRLGEFTPGAWAAPFPEALKEGGKHANAVLLEVLNGLASVSSGPEPIPVMVSASVSERALPEFRDLRVRLAADIDDRYGEGRSSSAMFRQFKAEYEVEFPTASLDRATGIVEELEALDQLLMSVQARAAGRDELIVTGEAGAGKTHAICDTAVSRHERGMWTVVLFGERFASGSDPWSQIIQQLGLPASVGRDELLSAFDAAGEAIGHPVLLCIDGLNETSPRSYWQHHLTSVITSARRYEYIKVCVSCRSSYLSQVLPGTAASWLHFKHEGFTGIEFDACKAFFDYYNLQMPSVPMLQADFANPLFLRLVCEAAIELGLTRLPVGWHGIYVAVEALIAAKNARFSKQFGVSPQHRVPEKALWAFVTVMRTGSPYGKVQFTEATAIVQSVVPQGLSCGLVIDWLVGENLLHVDADRDGDTGDSSDFVKVSFERMADHLLAAKYLDGKTTAALSAEFAVGGSLRFVVESANAADRYRGLLEALTIQVPERFATELPWCPQPADIPRGVWPKLLDACVSTLAWRDPTHLSEETAAVVQEALSTRGLTPQTFDGLVDVAAQSSPIDARFLSTVLSSQSMGQRDGFWCAYLHASFQEGGPVKRLIMAAIEMRVETVDTDVLDLWATALLWFCAASDRRVRDYASKALVRITERRPGTWSALIDRFASCDDEYVVERCLTCAYGALIRSQDMDQSDEVALAAYRAVFADPLAFQNALIRDAARCIIDLAVLRENASKEILSGRYLPPYASEWPLSFPSDEDLQPTDDTEAYPMLQFSCTMDDFFRYTLLTLSQYDEEVSQSDMGRWILREVLSMGYSRSSAGFDGYLLYHFGGGRGKPKWAERIGKKYQWIALARLAARIADNLTPKDDEWYPKPLGVPFTYLPGRDIDPTMLARIVTRPSTAASWWQPVRYDLSASADDDAWLSDRQDLPNIDDLISTVDAEGRRWFVLEIFPAWETPRPEDDDEDGSVSYDGRRRLWMRIRSYLIPEQNYSACWKWLSRQRFMNCSMPEGTDFQDGFIGEYPWAAPFTMYPDEYNMRNSIDGTPYDMTPTSATVMGSHEYDAFTVGSISVTVPARAFFSGGDLVWNKRAGYCNNEGKLCFQDPSFDSPGLQALLVDADHLHRFLSRTHMRIVWTILAEKLIYGNNRRPRLQFNQCYTIKNGALSASKPIVDFR